MNTMKTVCSILALASVMFCVTFAQAIPPAKSPLTCNENMPTWSGYNSQWSSFWNLCKATEDAVDFKNDQDKDGLVGKVVNAAWKLDPNSFKPCDADKKLGDYDTKLDLLEMSLKEKVSASTAIALRSYLNAAVSSIATYQCQ